MKREVFGQNTYSELFFLDEATGYPPHIIEHQLAHEVKDPLGRAYNRTKHLPERVEMMQHWANYHDSLMQKAKA